MDLLGDKSADFSACRTYRYSLWRWWDRDKPYALFICLNPSTADETNDDPTIRRCINFAKDWGFGGLCVCNLFALRATDPAVMKSHPEPVGPDNDEWLSRLAAQAGIVIAAWGVHGTHRDRAAEVIRKVPELHCLGTTKDGHPRHPLYLKKTSIPIRM